MVIIAKTLKVITDDFTLQFKSSLDTQYNWYSPATKITILKICNPPNSSPTQT